MLRHFRECLNETRTSILRERVLQEVRLPALENTMVLNGKPGAITSREIRLVKAIKKRSKDAAITKMTLSVNKDICSLV